MSKSEAKIQSPILRYLSTLPQCWAVKAIYSSKKGCPDILCCYQGRFIGLEVKAEDKKPSLIQEIQGELIKRAGGEYWVVRSVADVKNALGVK